MSKTRIICTVCLFCFLLFVLHFSFCAAQQRPFRNYTVEDGLAGSVVNYALQDSKGYIWFATETGVSRFDGINFKNFTVKDGLQDNTILKIYEDRKGRIWFLTFNGIPSCFWQDKITQLDSAKKFQEVNLTSMLEDTCGSIWLGTFADGLFSIKHNKLVQYKNFGRFSFNTVAALLMDSASHLWIATDSGIFLASRLCQNENELIRISTEIDSLFIMKQPDNSLKVFYEKEAFDRKNVVQQLSVKKLTDTLSRISHNLWIDAQQFGFTAATAADSPKYVLIKDIKDKIPSFLLEDKEKSIWLTTLLGGVYFLPYYARDFFTYSQSNGLSDNTISTVISGDKGNILVGTGTGRINLIGNNTVKVINGQKNDFFSDKINCMLRHTDGSTWCGTDDGIKIIRGEKILNHISLRNVNALSQDKKNKEVVWAGTINGFFRISNKKEAQNISRQLGIKELRVEAVYAEHENLIWLGCKDGLWKYDGITMVKWNEKNPLLGSDITFIGKSAGGILWAATQGNGLIAIDHEKVYQVTAADGICDDRCNSLFIDSQDNVWLATNRGISKIHVENRAEWKFLVKNFTRQDGLISGEVNDILKTGSTVYAATAGGLTVFDENKILQSTIPPPLYITSVKINDADSSIKAYYDLQYTQNNIRIDFIGLSYAIAGGITYRYRLLGIDTAWKYTPLNSINFPLLPPNRYTFKVSAMNKDGIWNEQGAGVSFVIHPPFWQTAGFRIGTVFFSLIILILLYYYISRLIKRRESRKNQLQQRILEAEQKAIRAQMNPHFIFNALNSIQRFIVENDTLSANEYLAKFGKLIRRILDNSKHSSITFADELETLKLYLDLEALRFENKFRYTIEVDPAIDIQQSHVPTMLIQPYVENAIWHGLMNKNSPGKLEIKMKLRHGFIVCTIEDNGVGRQKAMEMKNRHKVTHKSSGMELTRERLEIINAMREHKLDIQVIDLSDDKDNPSGTRVEIKIPVDF